MRERNDIRVLPSKFSYIVTEKQYDDLVAYLREAEGERGVARVKRIREDLKELVYYRLTHALK